MQACNKAFFVIAIESMKLMSRNCWTSKVLKGSELVLRVYTSVHSHPVVSMKHFEEKMAWLSRQIRAELRRQMRERSPLCDEVMGIKCAEKAGENCHRRLIARVHLPIPIRCWDDHDGLVVALRQTPPQVSLPANTQEVQPASNLASH
jgi:hypothetical protein